MKFEQPSRKEELVAPYYVIYDKKLNRDDILEGAALILENDPEFPDKRGERADHLRAKRAIREALKKHGALYFSSALEQQIDKDAYEVLSLFKQ